MPLKYINKFAIALSMGCATTSIRVPNEPPLLERRVNESLYDFGKRICAKKPEAFSLDNSSEKCFHWIGKYQVQCEEHGGFQVFDLDNLRGSGSFDYPIPKPLSLDDIADYTANKKTTLFAWGHGGEKSGTEEFIGLLPRLKTVGYTHVGLEVAYNYQEEVDVYLQAPTEAAKALLFSQLPYIESINRQLIQVIEAASNLHLTIICLDNRNQNDNRKRDEYMFISTEKIIENGGKIASLLGHAHIPWSRQSCYTYKTDDSGMEWQTCDEPLGRKLVNKYGRDAIGSVNLTGCYGDYISACLK